MKPENFLTLIRVLSWSTAIPHIETKFNVNSNIKTLFSWKFDFHNFIVNDLLCMIMFLFV